MQQIIRLPPDNMSYRSYRSRNRLALKDLDEVGKIDRSSVPRCETLGGSSAVIYIDIGSSASVKHQVYDYKTPAV